MKGFLFFDIDGTLVDSGSTDQIDEGTKKAMKQARANGYGCFISSGRNRKGIEMYMEEEFDGFVYADGAGVELYGQEPILTPVDEYLVQYLIDTVLYRYKGDICPWSMNKAYASRGIYDLFLKSIYAAKGDEELMNKKLGITHLDDRKSEDLILSLDVEFPDRESEIDFETYLDPCLEYISTSASYGRGGRCTGEVTMNGVTKGSGARKIVELLGGDMKNTYAFGDSMNDAMILKEVQYGICMGNGAEELKTIADYVTDDINQGGIEKAMKHFGII